ncbi:MAG TPA: FadR family transcriptional regulator [Clostridia bacterium]|nr:FadR family transcriptional regulator [Clostridia bacterium]
MVFQPIRTKKIYEEIIAQIKNLILEGKLRPGDKLMSERELAEQLQVGRSAVREAFRALEAMRIVEIKPGEGTYVKQLSADYLVEAISLMLSSQDHTTRELMELRKILEGECAYLAALRRTNSDLALMKQQLDEQKIQVEQGHLGYHSDMAFHFAIYKATGNAIIFKLMSTLRDTIQHALQEVLKELMQMDPTFPKQLYLEHMTVCQAIENGDPVAAREAMHKHLATALKGVIDHN